MIVLETSAIYENNFSTCKVASFLSFWPKSSIVTFSKNHFFRSLGHWFWWKPKLFVDLIFSNWGFIALMLAACLHTLLPQQLPISSSGSLSDLSSLSLGHTHTKCVYVDFILPFGYRYLYGNQHHHDSSNGFRISFFIGLIK